MYAAFFRLCAYPAILPLLALIFRSLHTLSLPALDFLVLFAPLCCLVITLLLLHELTILFHLSSARINRSIFLQACCFPFPAWINLLFSTYINSPHSLPALLLLYLFVHPCHTCINLSFPTYMPPPAIPLTSCVAKTGHGSSPVPGAAPLTRPLGSPRWSPRGPGTSLLRHRSSSGSRSCVSLCASFRRAPSAHSAPKTAVMSHRTCGTPEEPPESDPSGVKLEETEEEGEDELLLDASGLSCSQGSGSRDSDLLPCQELSWSSQDSSSSLGPSGDGGLLLLQPATGRRHGDHCEDRASRPGKSRIPGRDHRRYYHSHWRMEYLMDFDPRCHGMICMVCGSSLATLKLSTIKRHIRQKHPYSVNWSVKEKEVIINSWDAHLSMEAPPPGSKETDVLADGLQGDTEVFGLPAVRRRRRRLAPITKRLRQTKGPQDTKNLEQYLNESLQSWFRVEFLMDYDSQKNKLFCMLCGNVLPTLSLDDIKQHVLEAHPTSLSFTEEEKRCILGAWSTKTMLEEVQRAEQEQQQQAAEQEQEQRLREQQQQEQQLLEEKLQEEKLQEEKLREQKLQEQQLQEQKLQEQKLREQKLQEQQLREEKLQEEKLKEQQLKEQQQLKKQELQAVAVQEPPSILAVYKVEPLANAPPDPPVAPPPAQEAEATAAPQSCHTGWEHGVDLASWEMSLGGRRGRGRGQRRSFQERWRMEHLVDQNESQNGLVCMVCGVDLPAMKLSVIKAHVQESHPDSAFLSPQEKAAVVEKWVHKLAQLDVPDLESPSAEIEMEVDSHGTLQPVSEDSRKRKSPPPLPLPPSQLSAAPEPETPVASAPAPYRGQRRNYQLRWRGEYMMDYDCRRHGLICMVCGGTLATLKISTIKRHILQVHPHSIEFGAAEKQRVLEAYSEMALHYIHTEECFRQAEDPGLHAHLLCAGRATSSRGGGSHEPVTTAQAPPPALRQRTEDVIVV